MGSSSEFEWAVEKLEQAYKRGAIGKIAFHRRASALGFNKINEWLRELDTERSKTSHDRETPAPQSHTAGEREK